MFANARALPKYFLLFYIPRWSLATLAVFSSKSDWEKWQYRRKAASRTLRRFSLNGLSCFSYPSRILLDALSFAVADADTDPDGCCCRRRYQKSSSSSSSLRGRCSLSVHTVIKDDNPAVFVALDSLQQLLTGAGNWSGAMSEKGKMDWRRIDVLKGEKGGFSRICKTERNSPRVWRIVVGHLVIGSIPWLTAVSGIRM